MTEAQKPTVGRIVHYTLTADNADAVNRRRQYAHDHQNLSLGPDAIRGATGEQTHTGNKANEGDVLPMLIVRVWDSGLVNGQVYLDGSDTLWVTSAAEGEGSGQWAWPPRI